MKSYSPVIALGIIAIVAGILFLRLHQYAPSIATVQSQTAHNCGQASKAYHQHAQEWISMTAPVTHILPDEIGAYRHQRFIVSCPDGQTVLIVNDVSVGQRVPVYVGGEAGVRGIYVWNNQGGLVHFTHHDPSGGESGWILWRDRVYS